MCSRGAEALLSAARIRAVGQQLVSGMLSTTSSPGDGCFDD
jgi:hypothetical protein